MLDGWALSDEKIDTRIMSAALGWALHEAIVCPAQVAFAPTGAPADLLTEGRDQPSAENRLETRERFCHSQTYFLMLLAFKPTSTNCFDAWPDIRAYEELETGPFDRRRRRRSPTRVVPVHFRHTRRWWWCLCVKRNN